MRVVGISRRVGHNVTVGVGSDDLITRYSQIPSQFSIKKNAIYLILVCDIEQYEN